MTRAPETVGILGRAEAASQAWFVRVRMLCTVAGFVLVLGLGIWREADWPVLLLLVLLGLSLATNALFLRSLGRDRPISPGLLTGVFAFDIGLITVVLAWTGGAANPFSSAYCIPVTVAALLLPMRWTWVVVSLAIFAYGALVWPVDLPFMPDLATEHGHHQDMRLHLVGMWAAFLVVGPMVAVAVTRLRRAASEVEEEVAEARRQQAHAEKLAALATLSAGAAHELSTPLGTIAVAARELERRSRDSEVTEDARLIREEIDRCSAILTQLAVDVGAGVAEATQPTRIGDLVDGMSGDFLLTRIEAPETLLDRKISVPARQVERALHGLVKNAQQASEADEEVRIAVSEARGHLVIEVEDHGRGMDGEMLQRAGDPFFTTKPAGQGMGLGLFFARALIEHIGGTLEIVSKVGVGTRVAVRIPWSGSE